MMSASPGWRPALDTASRPQARIERLCRDATDPAALLAELGPMISDACEADAFVFSRLDPLTALWLDVADAGHASDSCDAYRRVFLRSPFADFAHAARQPERVVTVTRGEVARDPYTATYLDGYGFAQELHASYAHGGQGFGQLTLSRRQGPFAPAAARLLENSVAAITQALRRLTARETLEAIPGEHVALLMVDADGHLRAANAGGAALLEAERQAIGEASGVRMLGIVAELAARSLRAGTPLDLPPAMYVEPQSRQRYRLVTERLLDSVAAGVVLLIAEPVRALDSVALLRGTGLTEREAEVTVMTLRGLRSAEGADALAMSEHTYLSHLKAVYRKLGVSSRGELAALLLAGM
ncbi:MAG: helix-turn-helix transcriptional regulator [Myxococcales bacterium]|nr:helix-turn-helix transcriptional regulator [Myxococcales bacterium]